MKITENDNQNEVSANACIGFLWIHSPWRMMFLFHFYILI
jgi:hypothetical protein